MHTFKAAQPALLYLVPCCLGSSLLMAFIRGEFDALWNYSEENPSKIQNNKTKQQKQLPKQQQPKQQPQPQQPKQQPQPKTSINQKNESKKTTKETKSILSEEKFQQIKENKKNPKSSNLNKRNLKTESFMRITIPRIFHGVTNSTNFIFG